MAATKTTPVKMHDTLWFLWDEDIFSGTVCAVFEDFCSVRICTSQIIHVGYRELGASVFLTRDDALFKSCAIW